MNVCFPSTEIIWISPPSLLLLLTILTWARSGYRSGVQKRSAPNVSPLTEQHAVAAGSSDCCQGKAAQQLICSQGGGNSEFPALRVVYYTRYTRFSCIRCSEGISLQFRGRCPIFLKTRFQNTTLEIRRLRQFSWLRCLPQQPHSQATFFVHQSV